MNFLDERLPSRFWSKCTPVPPAGCWLWFGASQPKGYGVTWNGQRTFLAHRFAYEALVGAIPNGLHLDHLCRTPACVNPAHLEPVTNYVNMMRGIGTAAQHAKATHCPKGHPYSDENTYRYRTSQPGRFHRVCAACSTEQSKARRDRPRSGGYCMNSESHGDAVAFGFCQICHTRRTEKRRQDRAISKAELTGGQP